MPVKSTCVLLLLKMNGEKLTAQIMVSFIVKPKFVLNVMVLGIVKISIISPTISL